MNHHFMAACAVGALLLAGCNKQAVTVERNEKPEEPLKGSLEGVWRSLESEMAFRVLPDGKVDFHPVSRDVILSATFSDTGGRLRLEIAYPGTHMVENFIIRADHLEHEATGASYLREEEFLKRWLGTQFADRHVIPLPTPGESFYINTEQQELFEPENHTFGAVYLEKLKGVLGETVILGSLTPKGRSQFNNLETYVFTLDAQISSLPKVQNIRKGLVGIQDGTYDVQKIQSVEQSKTNQDVKIMSGLYKYHPNVLGERVMALQKETVRSEYKFKAAVETPRTIAKQPRLKDWDWGYTNESGYKTNTVQ